MTNHKFVLQKSNCEEDMTEFVMIIFQCYSMCKLARQKPKETNLAKYSILYSKPMFVCQTYLLWQSMAPQTATISFEAFIFDANYN